MLAIRRCLGLILMLCLSAQTARAQKEELYESLQRRADKTWDVAQQIWEWAEPGYLETRSAGLLSQWLEESGFAVERGIANIPTAFTATFGSGRPVIGILGEFDALPGLSQDAIPQRRAREAGGYGHGCGHHLFGAASATAAIALAERMADGDREGTIRFYGCPAEEGGSAKVFLVLDGQFDDCDVVLHWHPSDKNAAGDRSSLARMAVKFRFFGRAAHAAGAPDQGRSALDAVELTNHAAQLLREHTPDSTRLHHVITAGGGAPNVVPEFAEVYYYVRHPQSDVVRELYRRLLLCAQGAALATETRLEIDFEGGIKEILPNEVLANLCLENLREQNDLQYSEPDRAFAVRLQTTLSQAKPLDTIHDVTRQSGVSMGSTDVGDVSWVVPTAGFNTACFVPGVPGHSWQAVACGRTAIARQGMDLAARVLAATAWDLLTDPARIAAAREEHIGRTSRQPYQTLMQPNQQPPLDYRRPASERLRERQARVEPVNEEVQTP